MSSKTLPFNGMPMVDAAQRLGLSWGQAWRLVLTGALPGRREGRRWMVDAEAVDRLVAERQR